MRTSAQPLHPALRPLLGAVACALVFLVAACQSNSPRNSLERRPDCAECSRLAAPQAAKHVVYESEHWRVMVIDRQRYLGRCLVLLLRHTPTLSDISDDEWLDLADLLRTMEAAERRAFGAAMFNWNFFMNNAYRKTPAVPHVHGHLRPRYRKSVEFEGLEFRDAEFGSRPDPANEVSVPSDVLDAIANKLREAVRENERPE